MIAWIIPMIAGLIMDCVGIFILLQPFLSKTKDQKIENKLFFQHQKKDFEIRKRETKTLEDVLKYLHDIQDNDQFYSRFDKMGRMSLQDVDRGRNRWGFGFLITGFILMIIANIIQWNNI